MLSFQRGFFAPHRPGVDAGPSLRTTLDEPARETGPTLRGFLLRWLILVAVAGGILAIELSAGVLPVTKLEVDVFHLMDGFERVARGQVTHVDFSTPLGDLSIAAGAVWRALGLQHGQALILSNFVVAMLAAPIAAWAWLTRLGRWPGALLGVFCMFLLMQLGWRLDHTTISFAMAYNRWGWGLAMPLIPLLVLPSVWDRPGAERVDGALVGATGAALFWLKASFAAGFGPVWLLWALLAAPRRTALASVTGGLVAIVAIPVAIYQDPLILPAVVQGYVQDLIHVAYSPIRPEQVLSLGRVLTGPVAVLQTVAVLFAILILARTRLLRLALLWGAVFGFASVLTWQNHLSEPFATYAFAACMPAAALLVRRAAPELQVMGRPAANVMLALCLFALAFGARHMIYMNQTISAGHRVNPTNSVQPLDYMGAGDMAFRPAYEGIIGKEVLLPAPKTDDAPSQAKNARQEQLLSYRGPRTIAGRTFANCSLGGGWHLALEDLRAAWLARPDLHGKTLLNADVVNQLWLFLDTPPQKGGQLWLYDALGPALTGAELMAVADCPFWRTSRNMILDEATSRGFGMTPVLETAFWAVYALTPPEGEAAAE